ncbi:hypothetical protein NX059_011286 [Plenodomus lindquistii]|nr:hypothetical protein NX059_011286 [Plenodomus lindquistii]
MQAYTFSCRFSLSKLCQRSSAIRLHMIISTSRSPSTIMMKIPNPAPAVARGSVFRSLDLDHATPWLISHVVLAYRQSSIAPLNTKNFTTIASHAHSFEL